MLQYGKLFRRRTTFIGLLVAIVTISRFSSVFRNPATTNSVVVRTSEQLDGTGQEQQQPIKDIESLFGKSYSAGTGEKDSVDTSPSLPSLPRVQETVSKTIPATKTAPAPKAPAPKASPPLPPAVVSKQPMPPLPSPPPPSFNFTIDEPDGCDKATAVPPNVKAVFSSFPRKISMDNLIEVVQAGLNPGAANFPEGKPRIAMCKTRQYGNYVHFPHMMQQFSRCFSFWQIFSTYQPYLHMYTRAHGTDGRDEFNRGMFRIFEEVFNVTIVYDFDAVDESTLVVKPLYDIGMEESLQQGIVFQKKEHAQVLRERVQEFYQIPAAGCQTNKTEPAIAILNRKKQSARFIVNAKRLQRHVQKLTNQPVILETFENKTFMEQISFMSQVDILISPHGAQLTSLSFIPSCGSIFEIFPRGYYLPHFFGPQAITSGLRHGYVYNGANVNKEWYKSGMLDRTQRFRARRSNVCVPLETSLTIIGKMVDKWKVCCQEKQNAAALAAETADSA